MNTTPRTTTRTRHDAYAQRVSDLADDAVRAAAKACRVATALLDLEREAAEQRTATPHRTSRTTPRTTQPSSGTSW